MHGWSIERLERHEAQRGHFRVGVCLQSGASQKEPAQAVIINGRRLLTLVLSPARRTTSRTDRTRLRTGASVHHGRPQAWLNNAPLR